MPLFWIVGQAVCEPVGAAEKLERASKPDGENTGVGTTSAPAEVPLNPIWYCTVAGDCPAKLSVRTAGTVKGWLSVLPAGG